MSRIAIPAIESATCSTAGIYGLAKKIPSVDVLITLAAVDNAASTSLSALLNTESVQDPE